jgi:hypothetical protein
VQRVQRRGRERGSNYKRGMTLGRMVTEAVNVNYTNYLPICYHLAVEETTDHLNSQIQI